MTTALTPLLHAYRAASWALGPLAGPILRARARRGKEDPARIQERFGHATRPRPTGPHVWLHGASVGESLALLTLLKGLRALRPDLAFVVTTNTTTSAALLAQRLPARAVHQFVPLDRAPALRRFLGHWRPNLVVLAESELWPNLVLEVEHAGLPAALVNARLSARSLARWRRTPATARRLLAPFAHISAADTRTAEGLTALTGRPIANVGNLKNAAEPLPVDPDARARFHADMGDRPVWLAASTHPGEDEIVLTAHADVRAHAPDALLILAPRHPERGAAVSDLARAAGFATARRAAAEPPTPETAVYVADTMGEMGLWYAVAQTALIGGSLVPGVGGHNPIEPALARVPILTGPHTFNFEDLFDELIAADGAWRVSDPAELARAVRQSQSPAGPERAQSAHTVAIQGAGVLQTLVEELGPLLPEPDGEHASA